MRCTLVCIIDYVLVCFTVISFLSFFFLMIRRPPRSTPLSLHDALPIFAGQPLVRLPSAFRFALEVLPRDGRSEEHTSELQSLRHLVCRLLLEKKNKN